MPIAPRCPTSACPPHPYLLAPSLHIGHLPSHVREDQIRAVFQAEYPLATVCFARTKNGRNRGALRPRVDFPDLKSAERALATLHMRRIADTEPLIVLQFFITNNMKTLALPDASVSPRLIKVLPAGCTEETLFDLLRPYDPLYSVRIDPVSGGLVQFWTEANAKDAEIGLAATKTVLSAYDPCSLFCSNISFDLNAMVLRTHFEEFGHVISAEILTNFKTQQSRGCGFITFSLAAEAAKAMKAMHGTEIQWKALSVSYRVLRKDKKHTRSGSIGVPQDDVKKASQAADVEKTEESKRAAAPSEPADPCKEATAEPSDQAGSTGVPQHDVKKASQAADVEKTEESKRAAPPSAPADPCKETVAEPSDQGALDRLQALYDAEVKRRVAAETELERVNRLLEMAESRLKILQLESDRPLWEKAKKKREEDEKAECAKAEERRRAVEVEESRRKMREFQEQERERKRAAAEAKEKERLRREAEEKARQEKEERERKAREQAERARQAREARDKREREARWKAATQAEEVRCAQRDEQLWGAGAWTPARALERLKLQLDDFDKIKFSEAQPLTFRAVPWPVLTDPLDIDIEQINWEAVETFFARAKVQMLADIEGYSSLVGKVHRAFHPDRWKARGVLVSVMDEELRTSLETAGNVVAQAMTPLWRKSKGYT